MEANMAGLEININKTKFMRNEIINNTDITDNKWKWLWSNISFKNLGSNITQNNNVTLEIQERIASGNRCFYALSKIMKARYISKKLKIRVYKTIIKPIVVYGSESWTLTKFNCNMLAAWERKNSKENFWT